MTSPGEFELDADEIVAAAIAVLQERGLDAVSMRNVADRLGVSPMPLYTRVGNKAALIRLEAYNVFNHHNMYPRTDIAQVESFTTITGFEDDWRRMQLGFKFEF